MSKPKTNYSDKDILAGIRHEIISTMSSLNMYPEKIDNPKGEYLSEIDSNVMHAMEHLHAVSILVTKLESKEKEKINHESIAN